MTLVLLVLVLLVVGAVVAVVTGRISGGMGPGTPAMDARGSGVHHRIHDGLWIVGNYRSTSRSATAACGSG